MHWIRNRLENGKTGVLHPRRKPADFPPRFVHDAALAEEKPRRRVGSCRRQRRRQRPGPIHIVGIQPADEIPGRPLETLVQRIGGPLVFFAEDRREKVAAGPRNGQRAVCAAAVEDDIFHLIPRREFLRQNRIHGARQPLRPVVVGSQDRYFHGVDCHSSMSATRGSRIQGSPIPGTTSGTTGSWRIISMVFQRPAGKAQPEDAGEQEYEHGHPHPGGHQAGIQKYQQDDFPGNPNQPGSPGMWPAGRNGCRPHRAARRRGRG